MDDGALSCISGIDGPPLDETSPDLQRALTRYMDGAVREWQAQLEAVAARHEKARWGSEQGRQETSQLLDFMRWAVEGFARIGADPAPDGEFLNPEDYTWINIADAAGRDESAGRRLWGNVKRAAAEDLKSGRAGAIAVEGPFARPLERAEYLAVWAALADGLQPRNGLDRLLIDGMAQAWVMHRRWLNKHVLRDSLDTRAIERDERQRGNWETQRQGQVEAIAHAALMADRFQRSFMRLLKSYRDQRRLLGNVVVSPGAQLNVADQQVNVSGIGASR